MQASLMVSLPLYLFCLTVPLTIAGANIAWGMLLAGLLVYAASGGSLGLGAARGAMAKPLGAYFVVAVLAAAAGVDPAHSARYVYKDAHKLWLYLLFCVALGHLSDRKKRDLPMLGCLAAGFAAASLIGVAQSVGAFVKTGVWERAHAFVHPVVFGEQSAIACLGALCFLISPGGRVWPRRIAGALACLTAMALLFSNTRGATAGFAAGAVSIAMLVPKLRRRAWMTFPIGILILAAAVFAMERLRYDRSLVSEAIEWRETGVLPVEGQLRRLAFWKAAWRMGIDRPWTGVGLNNYRAEFPRYFSGVLDKGAQDWGSAHNLYLHQFAERGLLGAVVLLWLLWALWARARERAREAPDAWNLWAFGTTTAFLVMNVTEVALQTEILWMLVFFVWIWAETRFVQRG